MAANQERFWEGLGREAGLSRRARKGCFYKVYLPDALMGRAFLFGGEETADISDAERAITSLEARSRALVDTEALARLLLRAESVASSKIEGLVIGARRLLQADAARESGEVASDVTAAEVLGNIDAMSYGAQAVQDANPIDLQLILETHRRLLINTSLAPFAGKLREQQNWIGGNSHNPCTAVFVPPPHEMVRLLLEDLCAFCNDDSLPPVAQAAIAHAQFETIHPFIDGNGRVGRALIHMVFRRRGLTHRVSPPVSLILATRAQDYIDGLTSTRYLGDPNSQEALAATNQWIGTFSAACERAAKDAMAFELRIKEIQESWRKRVGALRSDSAALRLITVLPGAPVITLASASKMIGRSLRATIEAMQRLTEASVVFEAKTGRQRKQVFEAHEVIDLFSAFERQLASPVGNTSIGSPVRPVPAHG